MAGFAPGSGSPIAPFKFYVPANLPNPGSADLAPSALWTFVGFQDPWQYTFIGGNAPFVPSRKQFPPGAAAGTSEGTPSYGEIVRVTDLSKYVFVGGTQPFAPRRFFPIQPPVVAANPPPPPQHIIELAAWQPQFSTLIEAPGLNTSFVQIGPPATSTVNLNNTLAAWILFVPQPMLPGLLNPAITAVPANNPPFGKVIAATQMAVVVQAAQPDPSLYTFIGGQSPFYPRIFWPQGVPVSAPPPAQANAQRPAFDTWFIPPPPLPYIPLYLARPPPVVIANPPALTQRLAELAGWISLQASLPATSPYLSQPLIYNAGNTHLSQFGGPNNNSGWIVCTPIQLSWPATLQSISADVPGTASGNIWLGLYTSTSVQQGAGQPNTLVATTAITAAINGWQTLPTTTNPLVAAGNYWIAIIVDNNTVSFDADVVGQVWAFNGGYTVTSPPNPVPTNASGLSSRSYANYATFTTAAQPVVVPKVNQPQDILSSWSLTTYQTPFVTQSTSGVRVDNPPFGLVPTLSVLETILTAWVPPDPPPTLRPLLSPSAIAVRVDNPPSSTEDLVDFYAVLVSWIPPDPAPTLRPLLAPYALAVQVSNPPPYSSAILDDVLVSWIPPDPAPIVAGKLNASFEAVFVAAPPQSSRAGFYGVLNAWIPPDPAPIVAGEVNASTEAVAVNAPPPYSHVNLDTILAASIPPPPQPIVNQQLNSALEVAAADNPPFAGPARATQSIIYASLAPTDPAIQLLSPPAKLVQPAPDTIGTPAYGEIVRYVDIWQYTFLGGPQPFVPPRLVPPAPPAQLPASPQHLAELASWLPAFALPQTAPFTPRAPSQVPGPSQHLIELASWIPTAGPVPQAALLNPAFEAVRVDNPPFGIPPKWLDGILAAWIPPPPQPPVAQEVNAVFENVPVTTPPRYSNAALYGILSAWIPPDPQAPVGQKLNASFEAVRVDSPSPAAHRIDAELGSWLPPDPRPYFPTYLVQPLIATAPNGPKAALDAVLVSFIPPAPQPIVARNNYPSLLSVAVNNPPISTHRIDVELVSWLPPSPQPILPIYTIQPFISLAPPVPASQGQVSTVLISWLPPVPAPIVARNNYPSLLAVQVNQPPIASHRIDIELVSWLPPAPQPILPTYVVQPFIAPPIPASQGQPATVNVAWLPPSPAPIVARNLPPSLIAVPVNNPPFELAAALDDLQIELAAWIPPDPSPTLRPLISPAVLAVKVDNPPFGIPPKSLAGILAAWIPQQLAPTVAGVLNAAAAVPLPPYQRLSPAILLSWQVLDQTPQRTLNVPQSAAPILASNLWLPTVLSSWQTETPPQQRSLSRTLASRADNPPFGLSKTWINGVLSAWIQPPTAPIVVQKIYPFLLGTFTPGEFILLTGSVTQILALQGSVTQLFSLQGSVSLIQLQGSVTQIVLLTGSVDLIEGPI